MAEACCRLYYRRSGLTADVGLHPSGLADYRTVGGVSGPLVIVEHVKVRSVDISITRLGRLLVPYDGV